MIIQNTAVLTKIDGKIHQVALTKEEGTMILNLIQQLHQGTIKVLPNEFKNFDLVEEFSGTIEQLLPSGIEEYVNQIDNPRCTVCHTYLFEQKA